MITAEEYVALRASVGWGSPDLAKVETALSRSLAIIEERDEAGQLVGLARAVGDGMYVLLVDVVVHPDHQGSGIGRRLVERMRASYAVDHGNHVALFAAPDVAPFYESHGWRADAGSYLRP